MRPIDYSSLCTSALDDTGDTTVTHSLRHNLAILRAIHWGAKGVLTSDLEFDPRANYWNHPERRFLVAFLSDTWKDWPNDAAKHPALERLCAVMSQAVTNLRRRGAIQYYGVDYDRDGSVARALAPVRAWAASFQSTDWATCRPRRLAEFDVGDAMLAFLDRVERDGFGAHERTLQQLMRWWAVLGVRSTEQFVERQRFFWLYRLLLCTTNAYVNAGAQYFGPIIGNTPVSQFRATIHPWRDGQTPEQAPLIAHDKDSTEPSNRSRTNMVRELWGFLNLQRGPFYNAKVAEYLEPGDDPITATLRIGQRTHAWLAAHPEREEQLSDAFARWLPLAQREGQQPLARVRRFDRRFDANGNAIESGAPLDEALNTELVDRGSQHLLELFNRSERAAIMLHLALDAVIGPFAENTLDTGAAQPLRTDTLPRPHVDPAARLRAAKQVWIYAPGSQASEFANDRELGLARVYWDDIDDVRNYPTRQALFNKLAQSRGDNEPSPVHDSKSLWNFARATKPGDIIIARKGLRTIVGVGEITKSYEREPEVSGSHRLGVEWFWHGHIRVTEGKQMATPTFVDGTPRKMLRQLLERELPGTKIVEDTDGDIRPAPAAENEPVEPYTLDEAVAQLFFTREQIEKWQRLLERRRNLVLMGPPGVGKTYVAQRIAKLITGDDSRERIQLVQFHQAYSYEQFVLGYRPAGGSLGDKPQFELAKGPLLRIAEQALREPDSGFVLIIDEINRGNISRILGEALMLLEADKREETWGLELAYGLGDSEFAQGKFYLPNNLYVIGTMNTADRSLAVVDYALRRRFAFVEVSPQLNSETFADHAKTQAMPASALKRLRERIGAVNRMIEDDRALGRGFAIGHSFFTVNVNEHEPPPWQRDDTDPETLAHQWLDDVFECEIEPLLAEYWAESPEQFEAARGLLWHGRGHP